MNVESTSARFYEIDYIFQLLGLIKKKQKKNKTKKTKKKKTTKTTKTKQKQQNIDICMDAHAARF